MGKDGSSCPGNTTCCMSPQGTVGCCPYENASCCSDGLHCCPNGYTCDLAKGQCTKGSDSFLAFVSMKESSPAKTTPALGAAFPNLKDLLTAIKDYKKGDTSAALALLEKIATEGVVMGTDCYKVIKEIIG